MKYHALFMINYTAYGIIIQNPYDHPNKEVLEAAEVAFQLHDYGAVRVLKDRGDLFGQTRALGLYEEDEIIKWIRRGCSVFDWQKVLLRQPLPETIKKR